MKIAINSPVWLKIPPEGYGGIEMIVDILAQELTKQGHDVTLFASGDSKSIARLKSIYDKPQGWRIHNCIPEILHSSLVFMSHERFDIIHDHTYCGPLLANFSDIPVLHTLHGDFNEDSKRFYSAFGQKAYFNSISHFQTNDMPAINYVGNVYNAIDVDTYSFNEDKDDFLLYLSRLSPQKGTHLAIKAAIDSENTLIMAGKIDPGEDLRYFKDQVEPLIDDKQITYLGEVDTITKIELMAKAKAFLFPIQWAEPFGLVMVEALSSGTPVIAFRNGSVPEIINDKVGFIADDYNEFLQALDNLDRIKPYDCRKHAVKNFSPEKMVSDYLNLYEKIRSLKNVRSAVL